MSTSLYLRLAGPLQSWAAHQATGFTVNTQPVPTRKGLLGMLAACLGNPRGGWEPWLSELDLRIRVDKPGTIVRDFQYIGRHSEHQEYLQRYVTLTGATGVARHTDSGQVFFAPASNASGNALVHRTYLADAEFIVEVTGTDEHVDALAEAVANPVYTPYLGRKAFAPAFPFHLGKGQAGLLATLPTTSRRSRLSIHPITGDHNPARETVEANRVGRRAQLDAIAQQLNRGLSA